MKRTPSLIVFASLVLALGLVSCDAMFENNLFAGMTHKELTADSIQGQTPSQLKETLDSEVYMDQLAEDEELKEEVLDQLEGEYTSNPDTAEGQTAAILAADISIQTVPAAAQFAASVVGIISEVETLGDSPENLAETLQGVLPLGIQEALNSGQSEPPAEFVEMIEAFLRANTAYIALGGAGEVMTYLADVSPEEKTEIALNAVICGAIGLITTTSGNTANDLWAAMLDPANAGSHIIISDFSSEFDSAGDGYIGNLITAAGLTF